MANNGETLLRGVAELGLHRDGVAELGIATFSVESTREKLERRTLRLLTS